MSCIAAFIRDRSGATVVEYGLLVALICIALIIGLTPLGHSINGTFDSLGNTLSNARNSIEP